MDALIYTLTSYAIPIIPEAILGVTACILFLAATWRINRATAAVTGLIGIVSALLALFFGTQTSVTVWGVVVLILGAILFGMAVREGKPLWIGTAIFGGLMTLLAYNLSVSGDLLTVEGRTEAIQKNREQRDAEAKKGHTEDAAILKKEIDTQEARLQALTYSGPLYPTQLSLVIRFITLIGGFILVLLGWPEVPDSHAGEFHACLLLTLAGTCLVASANDLVTLFLSLELISIPTYVLLYLPRSDKLAQEAAMKYFLLSIFSSALLLFGFSYLYGLAGSTNIPTVIESIRQLAQGAGRQAGKQAVALVALLMVLAGLGFRISAVPFHFYAPDVYQGTSIPGAALLAFLPKVAGFIALVRLLGYTGLEAGKIGMSGSTLVSGVVMILWILSAVTMTLGNILAFLQNNVKRLLGYSSVAHAGYMLIGLAVAPLLIKDTPDQSAVVGGVEAVVFYLIAYGAMTIGAFAVLSYLHTPERPVETMNDLSGAARSHPAIALMMSLFLLSLVGMPWTAGFYGKMLLFFGALSVPPDAPSSAPTLFLALAIVGAVNAAISGYYYLRIVGVMFLGEELRPIEKPHTPEERRAAAPTLACILLCALFTLWGGIYPDSFVKPIQSASPVRSETTRAGGMAGPALAADNRAPLGPEPWTTILPGKPSRSTRPRCVLERWFLCGIAEVSAEPGSGGWRGRWGPAVCVNGPGTLPFPHVWNRSTG